MPADLLTKLLTCNRTEALCNLLWLSYLLSLLMGHVE
jgi:hypothetical protein